MRNSGYSELKPVVAIRVLRDRIPHNPAPPRPVSEYRDRDADGNVLHGYPLIAVIELQNWIESAISRRNWSGGSIFFAHGAELSLADDLPPQLPSEVFVKAVKEMKRINDTLEQRLDYNSRMDKIRCKKDLELIAEAKRQQDEAYRLVNNAACYSAATTRLRPASLAAKRALSAAAVRAAVSEAWSGATATPRLALMLKGTGTPPDSGTIAG